MSERKSLADQAFEAIAAVRSITDGIALEHSERHALRELKTTAESILESAMGQVIRLAETAAELKKLGRAGHLEQKG